MGDNVSIIDRFKNAWNVFTSRDPTRYYHQDLGMSYSSKPDRVRLTLGNERSIVASIYSRIAIDVAAINIKHVRIDENGRYTETIKSSLNDCLSVQANKDQTGRDLIKDLVLSMFDEGCVAVVPVDLDVSPLHTDSFKIESLRVAQVLEWYPDHVRIRLYNDRKGYKEDVILPKRIVAIIENPLYSVMNEPNSTAKRLVRKLNLIDMVDEQNSSGKLDLIIQLPYVIKTQSRKDLAEQRRKDIEMQLTSSKHGIAYMDATEKVVQLNRPIENKFLEQIDYFTKQLYAQLGMADTIFNGTADEATMLNYYNRTIEPILTAITEEFRRKFLTKTARTQGQTIAFFRDPFKLVPLQQLAELADTFTRNEILSSNEIRAILGFKPDSDPKSDQLINSNIAQNQGMMPPEEGMTEEDYQNAFNELDQVDNELDQLEDSI